MSEEDRTDWSFVKLMIQKYWKMGTLFIILGIIAVIGAILTLFFHINNSPVGGGGKWSIGDFSIGTTIGWFLWLLLWEVLFVVIPTAIVIGGIGYFWWRGLGEEEKELFRGREKKEKKSEAAGGAFGFIVFIMFLVIVYLNGNFFVEFENIEYQYWIITWLWAAFWVLIIPGIPALIAGIYYLRKKWKEIE